VGHAVQRLADAGGVLGADRQRLQRVAGHALALVRVTTSSISRTRRGRKRWPPLTSVAVALAICSMVKLL
jgi:hypothetical protein